MRRSTSVGKTAFANSAASPDCSLGRRKQRSFGLKSFNFCILKPLQGLLVWSSPGDLRCWPGGVHQPLRCILHCAGPAWYFFGGDTIPSSPCCAWRFSMSMLETGGCSASLQKTSSPVIPVPKHKPHHGPWSLLCKPLQSRFFFPPPAFLHPLSSFFFEQMLCCFAPSRSTLCAHSTKHLAVPKAAPKSWVLGRESNICDCWHAAQTCNNCSCMSLEALARNGTKSLDFRAVMCNLVSSPACRGSTWKSGSWFCSKGACTAGKK